MAMLQAYFDDAGTHGEALITAIGGWVADIEAWSSAEKAWNQTLDLFRPYGVEAYHWVEVQNKSGSWRGVPSTVMPEAQFMFANALSKVRLTPIWAAVVNEDFRAFATPEFLIRYPTPLDLCYEQVMRQMYRWAAKENIGDPVLPVFSTQVSHANRMIEAYERWGSLTDISGFVGAISFASYRQVIPLQCADLIASETAKTWESREYSDGSSKWQFSRVLDKAVGEYGNLLYGGCYAETGMKVAVKRFMETLKAS